MTISEKDRVSTLLRLFPGEFGNLKGILDKTPDLANDPIDKARDFCKAIEAAPILLTSEELAALKALERPTPDSKMHMTGGIPKNYLDAMGVSPKLNALQVLAHVFEHAAVDEHTPNQFGNPTELTDCIKNHRGEMVMNPAKCIRNASAIISAARGTLQIAPALQSLFVKAQTACNQALDESGFLKALEERKTFKRAYTELFSAISNHQANWYAEAARDTMEGKTNHVVTPEGCFYANTLHQALEGYVKTVRQSCGRGGR